jgi:hypothetical protein
MFQFLDGFKLTKKEFVDELDKLYHESFIKGQETAISFLKKNFPEDYKFDVKDILKVKNELDSYIADRTSSNIDNNNYLENTEKNGYASGYIQVLNECYVYLLRFSSAQSAVKQSSEVSTNKAPSENK